MAKQRHKIKQTIHQTATNSVHKTQSKVQELIEDLKRNPMAVLGTICTALFAEMTMTLNAMEDDIVD
jgi:Txe/YoeB family toxin of Txe-Axe toxin-antitoxin module|tara:strand:- start:121 stop:321 length:201 start_codon:yes stop_codon:yes gene_type:complete